MIKVPEIFKKTSVYKFLSQQQDNHKRRIQQNNKAARKSYSHIPTLVSSLKQTKSEQKISLLNHEDLKVDRLDRPRTDSMTIPAVEQTVDLHLSEELFDNMEGRKEPSAGNLASEPNIKSPPSVADKDTIAQALQKENLRQSPPSVIECSSDPGNIKEATSDLLEPKRHP